MLVRICGSRPSTLICSMVRRRGLPNKVPISLALSDRSINFNSVRVLEWIWIKLVTVFSGCLSGRSVTPKLWRQGKDSCIWPRMRCVHSNLAGLPASPLPTVIRLVKRFSSHSWLRCRSKNRRNSSGSVKWPPSNGMEMETLWRNGNVPKKRKMRHMSKFSDVLVDMNESDRKEDLRLFTKTRKPEWETSISAMERLVVLKVKQNDCSTGSWTAARELRISGGIFSVNFSKWLDHILRAGATNER